METDPQLFHDVYQLVMAHLSELSFQEANERIEAIMRLFDQPTRQNLPGRAMFKVEIE